MVKSLQDTSAIQSIFEHFPDGIFTIDSTMVIQYANPAFCNLLGYSLDEVNGTLITDHLGDLNILGTCMASVSECGHCNDQETVFKRRDGSMVHISKNVQALYDDEGNINRILVSIRDMSALHKLNKELMESKYDPHTQLPNRTKLIEEIDSIDNPVALILLNIDSFKELNAFYGHDTSDKLLIELGKELQNFITVIPGVSIYKLPVDEFALLFQNNTTQEELLQHVICMSHFLNNKIFTVANEEISISITIGAVHSLESENYLLEHANLALKDAKIRRKNYQVYTHSLTTVEDDYKNNRSWIKRLRNAIAEERVVAYFQPILHTKEQKVAKYEALVRIVEDGKVISPVEFLEISKRVKLYHHITMIMLDNVITELSRHESISCSINLSIEDIIDPQMSAYIIDKIQSAPCSDRIIFEILESEGIENYDLVSQFIDAVRQYGVRIAIDDFGSGYSNFIYITKLNIDYIKIDGSIIRNICTDKNSQIITKTIIDFATQLNIDTVAEFVSSQEINDYVKELDVTYVQGYHIGVPAPTILP